MGSGKTTIGRKLARVTGLDFVDADQYLEEKEGMKISDIFAQKGEAYFRDRETAYIRELSQRDGIVLSLGGGAVLRPENVAAVKETGLLIHLDTPFYRILKNLSYSNNRPLLNRPDKQAETRRLYNARKAIYHRVSGHIGAQSEAERSARQGRQERLIAPSGQGLFFPYPQQRGSGSAVPAACRRRRDRPSRAGGIRHDMACALPPSGGGDAVSTAGAKRDVGHLRFSPSCTLKRLYYWALSRFFERRTPMLHLFAT
ncbi:MAG: shikimate kinase [Butyricicoccaceae bacterium]